MYDFVRIVTQSRKITAFIEKLFTLLPSQGVYLFCKQLAFIFTITNKECYNKTLANMTKILTPFYTLPYIKTACSQYFCNLFLTFTEIVFLSKKLSGKLDSLIKTEGLENVELALERGQGVILYSGHIGNFFYYYYFLSQHYPSLVVATALDKDLQELYMIFHRMGCQGLDYDTTGKKVMLSRIKQHLAGNGVLFLLGDFSRPDFPQCKMFGRNTRLPRGTASLALELGVPVIPFYGCRTKGWQHKVIFGQPLFLHENFSETEKVKAHDFLVNHLEKFIMLEPSQWFYWFNSHERWNN